MSKSPYDDKDNNVVNKPPTIEVEADNTETQSASAQNQSSTETENKSAGSAQINPQDELTEHEPLPLAFRNVAPPPRKNWNAAAASSKVRSKKEPTAENPDGDDNGQSIEDLIKKLTKSFTDQQDAITSHRRTLLIWFACITAMQLITINVLIFICVLGKRILGDAEILNAILEFIKYFIGATFLELMGGLLIIVKYVFSREAYDMLKHLTRVEPSEKDQTQ